MVATAAVAAAVADRLRHYQPRNIVLDPVMVAKSGDRLLQDDAIAAIRELLVPMATVITPNAPVQQIWISARSTSFKLDLTANGFVLPKTGEALGPLLKRLIEEHVA